MANIEMFIKEKEMIAAQVPSARKSLGEFKPVMIYLVGPNKTKRTEVLAMANQHNVDGNRTYERGWTFQTREEAVKFAEGIKQFRIEECVARAKKYGFDI